MMVFDIFFGGCSQVLFTKNPKGGYFRGFRTPPSTDRNSESKTGSKNKAQVKLKTPDTHDFQRTLRVLPDIAIGLNLTFEVLFWRFLLSNSKVELTSIDYCRKCAAMWWIKRVFSFKCFRKFWVFRTVLEIFQLAAKIKTSFVNMALACLKWRFLMERIISALRNIISQCFVDSFCHCNYSKNVKGDSETAILGDSFWGQPKRIKSNAKA